MTLPTFRYHPDPIETGSIKKSDLPCECCGEAKGYIYSLSIYSETDVEVLCPWCIASGKAAAELGASFSDDHPLLKNGVAENIADEVCQRTPGYDSWQQENWQTHCGDACEYHGDAEKEDLLKLHGSALASFLEKEMITPDYWKDIMNNYEKGGSPSVYKFKCKHCKIYVYTMDFA